MHIMYWLFNFTFFPRVDNVELCIFMFKIFKQKMWQIIQQKNYMDKNNNNNNNNDKLILISAICAFYVLNICLVIYIDW